jgi:hypothetical protein
MINSKDVKHNRKHLIKARAKTYSTGERNKACTKAKGSGIEKR